MNWREIIENRTPDEQRRIKILDLLRLEPGILPLERCLELRDAGMRELRALDAKNTRPG